MIVMKFGGSSLSTPENILKIVDIVQQRNNQLVIVVSAFGDTTDLLAMISQKARNNEFVDLVEEIENKHLDTIKALVPESKQESLILKVSNSISELKNICKGIYLTGELTERSIARILSFGEMLSSIIITEVFNSKGINTKLVESTEIIVTDEQYLGAKVERRQTHQRITETIAKGEVNYVLPGFIASSKSGNRTTLGRGGSDYTAALVASAIEAKKLELWSNVTGMLTAHPSLVSSANTIKELSYNEALELSHFGAKVLYPPTIQPVLESNIPLVLKNTFLPKEKGTFISDKEKDNDTDKVVGISGLRNVSLLTVSGIGMMGFSGYSNRVFSSLSEAKVNIILISQSCSEYTICVGIMSEDVPKAIEALHSSFEYERNLGLVNDVKFEGNLSIIGIVGDRMKYQSGISAKAFGVLGENNINIKAIAQGVSERNISIVVDEVNEKKAINALHEKFFSDVKKTVHLFVCGTGNVGRSFFDILDKQQQKLRDNYNIELKLVGVSNSRKMLLEEDGINVSEVDKSINEKGYTANLELFLSEMVELNLRNSIFVDNTASELVSDCYEKVLENKISVVACNKIALSDNSANYKRLKQVAKKNEAHLQYETCVGAALPVINTIQDMNTSGDAIHKIEAVLSGSLNFIFNNYDASKPFAEIVKLALEEGYTEPDPLIDLSGLDVCRKILILAREAGVNMDLEDVVSVSMLPESCNKAENNEALFNKLLENEDHFKKQFEEAQKENKKLKFVASYENGNASVSLKAIAADHPFYHIGGKDNIVSLSTSRYSDNPLVIKGAGAGAEVTASGVFSDIMRAVNN